jgi:hypothetical protein
MMMDVMAQQVLEQRQDTQKAQKKHRDECEKARSFVFVR